MKPEPSPSERKLAAKRNNERVKLAAAFLNTLAVGTIGAAIIVPSFNRAPCHAGLAFWPAAAYI